MKIDIRKWKYPDNYSKDIIINNCYLDNYSKTRINILQTIGLE